MEYAAARNLASSVCEWLIAWEWAAERGLRRPFLDDPEHFNGLANYLALSADERSEWKVRTPEWQMHNLVDPEQWLGLPDPYTDQED